MGGYRVIQWATGNTGLDLVGVLVDDVVALAGTGTNVVTTCSALFARDRRLGDGNRARVLAACEQGGASVWASGSDPADRRAGRPGSATAATWS